VSKSQSYVSKSHAACRNNSCAFWNHSCECRNHIRACQNQNACGNYYTENKILLESSNKNYLSQVQVIFYLN
jgi:hypothetical protein